MGINCLPQIHLYSNTHPNIIMRLLLSESPEMVPQHTTILHFMDNTTQPPSSSHQIPAGTVYGRSSLSYGRLWLPAAPCRPHWEQAIDEAMVAFKSRSSMKPVKRGLRSGCGRTANVTCVVRVLHGPQRRDWAAL